MAQLNIKDDETHRWAGQLAARRGTSVARAVKLALRETLDRDSDEDRQARFDALMALSREMAAALPTNISSTEMMELVDREWEDDN